MLKALMIINKDFQRNKIDNRIYGTFVEHTGRAVYGGIYEPEHKTAGRDGFRGDVEEFIRELEVPLIRYPGGNFVSGYLWEDGVGPREERPVKTDAAWRSLESNQVGTNEFLTWAKKLGMEPMMAVNLGTRGAKEAAALLEYCNLDEGSYYSNLRREHGYEKPHGVRLWCLGNEMDGPWQICAKTPGEYARLACETAKLMKMIDPDIELVACGSSNEDMATMGAWEQEVLEECYSYIDYISMHIYIHNREDDTRLFMAKTLDMERFIKTITSVCDYVGGKMKSAKQIQISFDEWNVAYHSNEADKESVPWQLAPPIGEDIYNFQDAVVCGLMLICLIRNSDRVRIACQAQLINVIGAVLTETGGGAWRQTIYYPYLHASKYGRGTLLDVRIDAPSYSVGKYEGVPYLDGTAVYDEESGTVNIFCVNRHETESMEFVAALSGFEDYLPVEHIYLKSADKYAVNGKDGENVKPQKNDKLYCRQQRSGKSIVEVKLPELSWNVIRMKKAETGVREQ